MTFQKEVSRFLRSPEEVAAELFTRSPAGQLIAAFKEYAEGRKREVARGAETPALASLMIEKYGYGLIKAAEVLEVSELNLLTAEVDRLVAEIDPQHRKHQQYRWESRPAGLSITNQEGADPRIV